MGCGKSIEWKMMPLVPVPSEMIAGFVDTSDVPVSTVEVEERVAASLSEKMESAHLHFENYN